ncbi:MAG: hypothetical protein CMH22_04855 [Methylophaga sp.]|nr:hypothetical protein [Methylophaga sp.]|tara:strand:+ start:56453 stop:56953 length:501 start_codon:yes stop_codon:yes gene_type:complete
MSCIRTYAPEEVSLTVALLYSVQGFSPDTIIRINKDDNYFNTSVGASGGVERTHTPSNVYTLEVSLSQTSPSNAILTALATLDDVSRLAAFPIFAKDSSGRSLFLATSCWIERPPEVSYSANHEDRVWEIKCSDMVFNLAGNGEDEELSTDIARLTSIAGQFSRLL